MLLTHGGTVFIYAGEMPGGRDTASDVGAQQANIEVSPLGTLFKTLMV